MAIAIETEDLFASDPDWQAVLAELEADALACEAEAASAGEAARVATDWPSLRASVMRRGGIALGPYTRHAIPAGLHRRRGAQPDDLAAELGWSDADEMLRDLARAFDSYRAATNAQGSRGCITTELPARLVPHLTVRTPKRTVSAGQVSGQVSAELGTGRRTVGGLSIVPCPPVRSSRPDENEGSGCPPPGWSWLAGALVRLDAAGAVVMARRTIDGDVLRWRAEAGPVYSPAKRRAWSRARLAPDPDLVAVREARARFLAVLSGSEPPTAPPEPTPAPARLLRLWSGRGGPLSGPRRHLIWEAPHEQATVRVGRLDVRQLPLRRGRGGGGHRARRLGGGESMTSAQRLMRRWVGADVLGGDRCPNCDEPKPLEVGRDGFSRRYRCPVCRFRWEVEGIQTTLELDTPDDGFRLL